MKSLNTYAEEIYAANKAKGFWPENRNLAEVIALIHSELSEMLEFLRKQRPTEPFFNTEKDLWMETPNGKKRRMYGVEEELADTIIRCLDLAGSMNMNIEQAIEKKLEYNVNRPHKHGKQF